MNETVARRFWRPVECWDMRGVSDAGPEVKGEEEGARHCISGEPPGQEQPSGTPSAGQPLQQAAEASRCRPQGQQSWQPGQNPGPCTGRGKAEDILAVLAERGLCLAPSQSCAPREGMQPWTSRRRSAPQRQAWPLLLHKAQTAQICLEITCGHPATARL